MSKTAIIVYDDLMTAKAYCQDMAMAYASITGAANKEMGAIVALQCLHDKISPIEFTRKYHIIQGKPSMKASAMLAEFTMNEGGSYFVEENSSKRAAIKFTDRHKNVYNVEMTRTQLMLSRWPWNAKPGWQQCTAMVRKMIAEGKAEDQIWLSMLPNFKDNYGTEADWKNMLLARLTSESMRAICPEMASGIYTPEELTDVDAIEGTILPPKPVKTASSMLSTAQTPAAATSYSPDTEKAAIVEGDEVIEAEYTMTTEESQVDPAAEESPFDGNTPEEPELTAKQCKLIESIVDKFKQAFEGEEADKQFAAALSKRNVHSLAELGEADLQDIEDKLLAFIKKQSKN